ncbi:MAG: tetratricopeptide repeat protein [Bacteroidota bacterium]
MNKFLNKNTLYSIIIILAVLATYCSAFFHTFTNWDDDINVVNNPFIQSLNFNNLKYIFSNEFVGMYVPLTMLTYMFNFIIGGLNPLGFLAFNIIIHILNALLVFSLMKHFFKNEIFPLFIALIFAVHPMGVEGVSWISARSNVLFAFFYLLALLSYITYKSIGNKKDYYLTLILFLLSCFSKSPAVSLPLLLIAIDWYEGRKINIKSQLDKIPFLILSLIFGVLTIYFRSKSNHFIDLSTLYNPIDRIFFVLYSFDFYSIKLLFPFNLNPFYVYPEKTNSFLPNIYYVSLVLPILLAFVFYYFKASRKIILFTILSYLITVLFVLKYVPVGNQIVADRYAYLPCIFLFLGIYKLIENILEIKYIYWLSAAIVLGFGFLSYEQNKKWDNSIELYNNMIIYNSNVSLPYYNRALAWADLQNFQKAEEDFTKAIEFDQRTPYWAYMNRGNARKYLKNFDGAMSDYKKALEYNPKNIKIIYNIGNLQLMMIDGRGAISSFQTYISVEKNNPAAYNCLGQAYTIETKYTEAIASFSEAIKINSNYTEAIYNRALAYMNLKMYDKAIIDFSTVLLSNPNDAMAYYNRGLSYSAINKEDYACQDIRQSANLGYKDAEIMFNNFCK